MDIISLALRLDQEEVDRRLERDPGNPTLNALLRTKEGAQARFDHFDRITNSPKPFCGVAMPHVVNQ